MEKPKGPWNLSPEEAQEVDIIRTQETIKNESFNDLKKQVKEFIQEKQLPDTYCYSSLEGQKLNILSSKNNEIELVLEFLQQRVLLIHDLFKAHQIDSIFKISRDIELKHIEVNF